MGTQEMGVFADWPNLISLLALSLDKSGAAMLHRSELEMGTSGECCLGSYLEAPRPHN
jgi:hypothetical protein